MGGMVEDQEVIDLRWTLSWCSQQTRWWLPSDPTASLTIAASSFSRNTRLDLTLHPYIMQHRNTSQDGYLPRKEWYSLPMASSFVTRPQIQRDFTRFATTFQPKVQITQNKNLVKDIVNIYHIIVISYQTFMLISQKKSYKLLRF